MLVLAIVASLLVSAIETPTLAHADPRDPAARLQVIIKAVHVYFDRDIFGDGEMEWTAGLRDDVNIALYPAVHAAGTFDAGDGEDVYLNRVMPLAGDEVQGDVTPETGMPVYAGHYYTLRFSMDDRDPGAPDFMGRITVPIDAEHAWGIGTFTVDAAGSYDGATDYGITYEIRRIPLPDLVNRGIHVVKSGDGEHYCVTVQNLGERPSASTPLYVKVDGTLVRPIDLGPLDVSQTTQYCVVRSELPAQEHMLSFTFDELRQIPEMEESNNSYQWKIRAIAPTGASNGAVPLPQPKPSGAPIEQGGSTADLTVSAIEVNGQVPDGKNDCKAGKNGVTVIVKNAGTSDAGSLAVRLTVDGDDLDATIDGLAAGHEREARFENVQMKNGQHKLTATVEATGSPASPDEGNAARTVSVTCKDGK